MTVISDVVRAEIDSVMNSVVAPEPIIKIQKASSSDHAPIRISLTDNFKCEHTSIFKDEVVRFVSVELDISRRSVHLRWRGSRAEITQAIIYRCHRAVCNLISNMYTTKNNKLTNLYRWYDYIDNHANRDMELQSDLYQVGKYIISKGDSLKYGDDTTNGIMQALELIKAKHEARGFIVR